jgi:hypothetical protein
MGMPVQNRTADSKKESSNNRNDKPDMDDLQEDFSVMMGEVTESVKKYCARRPNVVLGSVFAIGFILGWKMRPW